FVGPSGAGKSTLVNRLCGEERQQVAEVRSADSKGRHTTTRRELIAAPGGGWVLDTPGLRELALWDAGEGLAAAFDDIAAVADGCRFADCRHESEPGCAVTSAVAAGPIDADRLDAFRKLQREIAALTRERDLRA